MAPDFKPSYTVRPRETRAGTHDLWESAMVLDQFLQPWTKGKVQKTWFRALYDENFLYVRYVVKDSKILVFRDKDDKIEVASSDRVELFFKTDDALERYYCLEVDPMGRVLDYRASFYRKFDYGWHWPKGQLTLEAEWNTEGYIVELNIGLDSLRDLGILRNGRIGAGIFRGDCKALGNPGGEGPKINWISWIDPGTEFPDFHVPSAFGELILPERSVQR